MALFKCVCKSFKRNYSITKKSDNSKWISVVGLEVHAQILSSTKLFSGSPNQFSSPVNTNVSLYDCSTPGTLPVLSKRCVEAGVLTALALNCNVNPVSMFDRKHYFYADLPTGYQITQQRHPLASNGNLDFFVFTPGVHKFSYKQQVKIKQLQLEQDSGKSLHDFDRSLIDLNRAGAALMEIVFEPDLVDGEEAAALVKELVSILVRLGTCSCKMEEGALRVDANVSIHKKGEPLGTRTEIKNISSVRAVAGAIRYEIERQTKLKNNGGIVVNETRAWDAENKCTIAMRDKEQVQDYRYMPEPNLPPLHLDIGIIETGSINVNKLRQSMPELPSETRLRFQESLGLTTEQAVILVNDNSLLNLFESALDGITETKLLANLLIHDFSTLVNKLEVRIDEFSNKGVFIRDVVILLEKGKISRNTARQLLADLLEGTKKLPLEIVTEKDLFQITNEEALTKLCLQILDDNPKIVAQYKNGKIKVFKAFLGIIANKSNQRADMSKCTAILKKLLCK